ncbi:hypothetical protein [Nonomuraea sp. SYSU D8015]|uniref:hypothetical protein n=1 Tax=Nonomuraea sp. SYSU D8015 TaxID=2593644 RepID=UPI0016601695|nr:hypothetical protein [Nonomuraea sp. SYSU D8015]
MSRLVTMAASVDGRPTLAQVDEMLAELRLMPRDQAVTDLIDDLLDYRSMLPA